MFVARIDNGTVTQVTVGDDADWCASTFGGVWVGTDQHVGIGWTHSEQDGFRPPQPYPSWTWVDGSWTPPVPYPDDDGFYTWDEDEQAWIEFDEDEA